MKLQKVLGIVVILVSGSIAVPFSLQIQNSWHTHNLNNALVSLSLFVAAFTFMVLIGWIKRVHK